MTAASRRRAEACFALARSTAFPAERASAIAKGEGICTRAGFSLDDFDIPGRHRAARSSGPRYRYFHFDSARRPRDPDPLAAFQAAWAKAFREAGGREGETLEEAQRRMFNERCAEAAERDRAKGRVA